ncbi:regulatory solute carrier protein family 1 member 1 isoform X1 [Hemicordylus capensis]|uniref:regulatory solute carrier protein family 1 member 1 isoform X1 n=1 Tax=Hemicordylus capensis TaxID=884348 RepID=UPI002302B207|nr:regulatory solute carrier protein family 1 member 1 isoform X1 [Hemicordylus capensis]
MLLTVFCLRRDRSELTFSLQVDADFELQNFRALCELESGIPAAESRIIYAERPLTDNHRSLASYGLKDGDVVVLQQVESAELQPASQFPGLPRIDFSSITVPGTSGQLSQPPLPPPPQQQQQQPPPRPHPSPPDLPSSPQGLDNPALLREMLLGNPHELSLLKERNPPLAEALLSGDLEKFTRVLVEQQQDRARREQERIRLFSADPFDLEAQAKIEEDIRQQNIEENMTIAMEEAPESFGQVVMLYINCKVNGHPVKAFVDSGAQMTIMSQACAERCNIMRLVDRRWAGIAKGVGTQKIIGRVHLAQVQIEGDFLPCSFSILEEQPMDMLLGLDMLKRHQCSIDLKKNVLVIGTTGSQTTFLPEGELPECARLAYGPGREDVRPEEIADQELAEALQKSAEEADDSDKATTSLGMPSLPASGGVQHPVRFPEASPKTSRPASRLLLDRSSSAPSVGHPCKGGAPAATAHPRAVRSVDSLLEGPATPERAGLPGLPPSRSGHAASAHIDAPPAEKAGPGSCRRPSLPAQDALEAAPAPRDALPASSAEEARRGLEPPAEEAVGNRSFSAPKQTGGLEATLPSEPLGGSQPSQLHLGPQPHTESGNDRPPGEEGPLRTGSISPLPARQGPASDPSSEEEQAEEGAAGLPSSGGGRPGSVLGRQAGGETSAEAGDPEKALVAASSRSEKRVVRLSGVNSSDCSGMEVELSRHEASWSAGPLPPSGLMPPGSLAFGPMDVSAAASLSASSSEGQLSSPAEEPCLSLTSALKELHQLLVENCKGDYHASREEDGAPLVAAPDPHATNKAREGPELDSREVELLFPESVGLEAAVGGRAAEAPLGSFDMQEMRQLTSAQGALVIQEPSDLGRSDWPGPSAASSQRRCGEDSGTLPPRLSSGRAAGCTTPGQVPSLSPDLAPRDEASWSSFPRDPGMPASAGTDVQRPPPPGRSPGAGPAVSPAVDIARIVGAGFTAQEAGEALEHAGGNVDLALLLLLAKNIVVPT